MQEFINSTYFLNLHDFPKFIFKTSNNTYECYKILLNKLIQIAIMSLHC